MRFRAKREGELVAGQHLASVRQCTVLSRNSTRMEVWKREYCNLMLFYGGMVYRSITSGISSFGFTGILPTILEFS